MSDFRLKVFLSVATHLSFTKASQELYISQPAISKHIKELESVFQTQLFERMGNSIALTSAGELLVEHSRQIVNLYQQLDYAMHQLHGDSVGELRLGASTTIAQYLLPPLIARFIELHPKVKLSLISGNSREIESAVERHEIDLGLIEGVYRRVSLKYTFFKEDRLIAIARPCSARIIPSSIEIEDLANYKMVLREQGSGTLDVIEEALAAHHIKLSTLNIPLYLGSTESIKRFVQHTNALGIVSHLAVREDIDSGKLKEVELKGVEMNREFSFVSLQADLIGLPKVFVRFALGYKQQL